MNVKLRRRWLLAVGAVVLLHVVPLGSALLKKQPEDAPRVTLLGYSYENHRPVASLRVDAPRRRAMRAIQTSLVAVEVGDDEQSVFWVRKESQARPLGRGIRMGQAQMVTPPLTVKAGTSAQFDALLPRPIWSSGQWRLVVLVEVESGGISAWKKRLGLCWRGKTLGPLLNGWTLLDTAVLRTEPITNALPRTADAPRP